MQDLFSPEALATHLVNLVLTALSLLIIYVIVKKLLYKPIAAAMQKRQEAISARLSESEGERAKAAELLAEAQKQLEDARAQAATTVAEAAERARRESERLISQAEEEIKAKRERATLELVRERQAMLSSLRTELSGLASAVAAQLIDAPVDEAKSQRLVDDWIAREQSKEGTDPAHERKS